MMLSDLDGYLYGVICSQAEKSKQVSLRKAFGGSFKKVPPEILQTVMDMSHNIFAGLAQAMAPYAAVAEQGSAGQPCVSTIRAWV